MTTLDMIKTKYMLYEASAESKSRNETIAVINLFVDDMDEAIVTSDSAVKENFRDEHLTRIKNFFYNMFGYEEEDVEQFGLDSGIVLRHSCLAERYKNYFVKMREIVNDDNYQDVCKLAMFTCDSYYENYNYLENIRAGIKFATQGITFYGSGEDTQGEFNDFIDKELERLSLRGKVYSK